MRQYMILGLDARLASGVESLMVSSLAVFSLDMEFVIETRSPNLGCS